MPHKIHMQLANKNGHNMAYPPMRPNHVLPYPHGMTDASDLLCDHQLLGIIPALIFTSDPDGAWEYVNPSFCAYTGYPEEALMGLGWVALLHDDERSSTLALWHSAIRSGAPLQIEHRLRGADGSDNPFRTQLVPQHSAAGAIIRWVGISSPVAAEEQVAEERALRQLAERSLDKHNGVIAITAHELRAPVTVLLGESQLLQRRLAARADAVPGDQRSVNRLVDQSLRLSRLINSLLDATQSDRSQMCVNLTPLDLDRLVGHVVQELQPSLPAHTLRLCVAEAPIRVMGDALRLEQVLLNLLQNAVKYSPQGGEISVQVSPQGRHARIAITDYGVGIAESIRPHLFQRFFRARADDGHMMPGLGLGLYISKAIIDLHGGSIEVQSTEGVGSTFTLLLPLEQQRSVGEPVQCSG